MSDDWFDNDFDPYNALINMSVQLELLIESHNEMVEQVQKVMKLQNNNIKRLDSCERQILILTAKTTGS